jgi:hypothetical protein
MLEILSQTNTPNPYLECDFDAPLVIGNLDRLSQNIYIDNTPYASCMFLVADDNEDQYKYMVENNKEFRT